MNSIEKISNNPSSTYWNIFTKPKTLMTPSVNGEIDATNSYNQLILDLIKLLDSKKGNWLGIEDADTLNYIIDRIQCHPLVGTPGYPNQWEVIAVGYKWWSIYEGTSWEDYPIRLDSKEIDDIIETFRTLLR